MREGVLMLDTTNNCIFELTTIDFPDDIKLSPQEKRVMRGLAKGMNNEQIALMLHISPRTVTTYREKVRRKCGCPSIEAAMYLVTSLGLLEE